MSQVWGADLFLLSIFLSGLWLSRSSKPYSVILLTIHKLISVAAFVFLAITTWQINRAATLSPSELTAAAVTGLLFLGTVASGGLLSTDQPMPAAVLRLHQVTPFLTALSTAATLHMLVNR